MMLKRTFLKLLALAFPSWKVFADKPRQQPDLGVQFCKGTQIRCPECDYHVSTAKRDILMGEYVSSEPWSHIEVGSSTVCPNCNAGYLGGRGLHTQFGWTRRVEHL